MTRVFNDKMPIYLQIIDQIRQDIASGACTAGSKVSSVRDLAVEYGVNPNTVQRALSELERDGLLFSERTAGRFITSDTEKIVRLRAELAERQVVQFLEQMASIGYDESQIKKILHQKWSDTVGHD